MRPRNRSIHRRPRARRGSVIVVVIWALALGAVITAAVQISAMRSGNLGRQAMARTEARWAARGGVEQIIATLAYYTENPDTDNAFRIYEEMAADAYSPPDSLLGASYSIEHYQDGQTFSGPMDEHTGLNINFAVDNREMLLNLPYMTEDVADAIVDWIDDDDEPRPQGAEASWYLSSGSPYEPRNAFMRNIAELELVAGAYPQYVRGEDWNLNHRFDANEDDGTLLQPPDDANGYLDAGWSQYLTAKSIGGGLAPSGQPKLYLPEATVEEVQERVDVSREQAQALVNFGNNPNNKLSQLFIAPLPFIREDGSIQDLGQGMVNNNVLPLEGPDFIAVFAELTMDDPEYRHPGKINLNTASTEVLQDVLDLDPTAADEILLIRQRSTTGIISIAELLAEAPLVFNGNILAEIADVADVRSNVFTITSVGRDKNSNVEVQLMVVVDRSSLPVHILEYREQ